MRRYGITLSIFAACVMASGVALGVMANGPGGRLYVTTMPITASPDLVTRLATVDINPDWTIGTWTNHGTIITNKNSIMNDGNYTWTSNNFVYGGFSPEVMTSNPTGYASLMMGLYNTGSVENELSQGSGKSLTGIMDVCQVDVSAGTYALSVIGGRGYMALPAGDRAKSTHRSQFAMPDPKGLFVGPNARAAWEYVTFYGYTRAFNIVDDCANAVVGDATADYINTTGHGSKRSAVQGSDHEIVGSRLFSGFLDPTPYGGTVGHPYFGWSGQNLRFVDRVADDCYTFGLYRSNRISGERYNLYPTTSDGEGNPASWGYRSTGFAATRIQNHWAAYALGWDNADKQREILMFIDYNDDGDAQDAGEALSIFDVNMSAYADGTLGSWADPSADGAYESGDYELVEADGVKFLIMLHDGNTFAVYELADNGFYAGKHTTDERVKLITISGAGGGTFFSFEYDAAGPAAIPEPATMLLLGTGTLGALGWLRRRRMR